MVQPNFFTKVVEETSTYGKFSIEPLPLSFGNSMGNALRRTLLSSLKGSAITQIRVVNADHMFSTIKGVKESVLEILLHLKQLKFETNREGSFMMHLEVKGAGKVTGKDISGEAKVVNSDLYIAEITDEKAKIDIDFVVETGVGSLGEDEIENKDSDYVTVEAFFSPVKRVNFKIEEARVGRKTNFDRLVMDIWTDGTVSPSQSLKDAATILSEHFSYVLSGKDNPQNKEDQSVAVAVTKEVDQKLNDIIID